ncbi:MAG: hypothetical protein LBO04_08665, partial [Spirochaetaceae bacterium]|nr:hypothetical protein [Spirochaetaceae bacterium]
CSAVFSGLTANGSTAATTTTLTLSFDKSVSGLDASNITIDTSGSTAAVSKGTLSGTGTSYTLPVTVSRGGGITVSVSPPEGYNISGTQTAALYCTAAFTMLTADGSTTETTTELTLTFDKYMDGLNDGNITVSPGSAAKKNGPLTKTATMGVYTLPVTVTAGGGITVSVSAPGGYSISGTPKTTTVYLAPDSFRGTWSKTASPLSLQIVVNVFPLDTENTVAYSSAGNGWVISYNSGGVAYINNGDSVTKDAYPNGLSFTGTVTAHLGNVPMHPERPPVGSTFAFNLYHSVDGSGTIIGYWGDTVNYPHGLILSK